MVPRKRRIAWKPLMLPLIGILAFFAYLYVFDVDILGVIETAKRVDLFIYVLSILLVFAEPFFYTLSWRALLSFLSIRLSIVKAYLYVWYGIFMNIIVPAASISGEVSKLYVVTREQSGTGGKVVATLVAQRLLGMGIIITSLIVGIGVVSAEVPTSGLPLKLTLFLAIATTIFLVLFVLLCFKEAWTLRIIDGTTRFVNYVSGGRWNLMKTRGDAIKAARMFHDSIEEFGRAPKTLLTSMLFILLSWISRLSIAYLVLLSLDFRVQWGVIIVTCSILVVLPARGVPEIAMATIYTLLGVPPEISATATILTRILTFWLRFFVGFAAQQWLEIKISVRDRIPTTKIISQVSTIEKLKAW